MTQYLTDPPPAVDALADMVDACASWAGDIYYPTAPDTAAGTFAVLNPEDETRNRYSEGATPIPSGSLLLTIHSGVTIGALETQAQAVQKELLAKTTGLLLRSASVGRCSVAGPAVRAGGETRLVVDIVIQYGLNS